MKRIITLLAFLALASSLFANGDPVATIAALTLSRNPVGVHVPEVQLKDEHLTVTPMGRNTLVRVEYLLYNNKTGTGEDAAESRKLLEARVMSAGYRVVVARGDPKR